MSITVLYCMVTLQFFYPILWLTIEISLIYVRFVIHCISLYFLTFASNCPNTEPQPLSLYWPQECMTQEFWKNLEHGDIMCADL